MASIMHSNFASIEEQFLSLLEPPTMGEVIHEYVRREAAPDRRHNKINMYCRYMDAMVYVRIGHRFSDSGDGDVIFTLANVAKDSKLNNACIDPKAKSTGFMDGLMSVIESAADKHGWIIDIENVHNEFLPAWFEKRGYVLKPDEAVASFRRQ